MLVSLSLLDWQGGRLVCRWYVVCYVLRKEKKMQVELGGVVNKACPYVVISGTFPRHRVVGRVATGDC